MAKNVKKSLPARKEYEVTEMEDGNLFLGSTTEISVGTGDSFHAQIENPAGSGVTIEVVRIVITQTSGSILFSSLHENPTQGEPSTTRSSINANRGSSNSAEGVLKAGAVSTDYDNASGIQFGVDSGVTVKDDISLTVPPGGVAALEIAGNLIGASGSVNVWWIEK